MKNASLNENCLAGMACPKCGDLGPFCISMEVLATVRDDGAEDLGDTEWGPHSYISCQKCQHAATVADFHTEKEGGGMNSYHVSYGFDVPSYGEVTVRANSDEDVIGEVRRLHKEGNLIDGWDSEPEYGFNYRIISIHKDTETPLLRLIRDKNALPDDDDGHEHVSDGFDLEEEGQPLDEVARVQVMAMAHLSGFTRKLLADAIQASGLPMPPNLGESKKQEILDWIATYHDPVNILTEFRGASE